MIVCSEDPEDSVGIGMRAKDSLTICEVVSSTTTEMEDEGSGELVVPTSAPGMKEVSLGSTYELDSVTEGSKGLDVENTLELEAPSETEKTSEDEGTTSDASEVAEAGSKTEVDKGSKGAEEDAALVMAASETLVDEGITSGTSETLVDEGTTSGASEAVSKIEVDKGLKGAEEDAAVVMAASEMLVEMSRREGTASPRLEVTEDGSTVPNAEAARDVVAPSLGAELDGVTSLEATARDA